MKYRFAAFKKEDGWYVLKENSRFNMELVKVPSNEVFRAKEKAYNPRTNEMYYEDLGDCWEGEVEQKALDEIIEKTIRLFKPSSTPIDF